MTHLSAPLRILALALTCLMALLTPMSADAAVSATITGRVVDAGGQPVPGLTIEATEYVADPNASYYDLVGSTTTGADGRYALAVRSDDTSVSVCVFGDQRVVGRCFGKAVGRGDGEPYAPLLTEDRYLSPESKGTGVIVTPGKTSTGVNFTLSSPARVRGIVRNPSGQPIAGREVTVRSSTRCDPTCREVVATGQTANDGSYDVAVLEPTSSPDFYCLAIDGAPVRHGTFDPDGGYSCEKSIRTGQVVNEAVTVVPDGGPVVKVHTPYWVGSAKVGWTLSARPGTWSPGAVDLEHAWFDGARKLGTGPTYTVKAAELGHRITLRTTAKASGYTPAVVDYTRPDNTVKGTIYTRRLPTISGSLKVGRTLKASASTPAPTAAITYRWLRNGASISGAAMSTYKLTKADQGKRISVKVTYTKTGYDTLSRTSARTATIKR